MSMSENTTHGLMEVGVGMSLVKEMRRRSRGGVDSLLSQIPGGRGFWKLCGCKRLSTLEKNQVLWGVGRRE